MVEEVIAKLERAYVTRVDYRDVTKGGLEAIKVLAETPQVAGTFPGLKDDAKRGKFLDFIEREMRSVDKKDRVDYLDLHLALNSILSASERTVRIPTEVLSVEFTDGFLNELDKFSSMIWPNDVADFVKSTMGRFFGIGVQISKEPGEPLKVVTPLLNTPAFRAGIKAGDLIEAVNGDDTEDESVDKLVQRIMGPKGTKVTLTIKRPGVIKPFDVDIMRGEIHIVTVKGWQRSSSGEWEYLIDPDSKIGYLRVTQFTGDTVTDVDAALKELKQKGVRSLVLDLRFNPGGLLRAAKNVADQFLRNGRVVSTEGRQVPREELSAGAGGRYLDGHLIVLVNQYSASAAEIVSGAMQDWQRGFIIGQRTYGKGSVQNVIPIRRGKARLKLTTAYYYLPLGRLLHRRPESDAWGVDPDIEVVMTPKQSKRWLEIRRRTDLLTEVDPEQLADDLAAQYQADIQLSTAVLMLKLLQIQSDGLAAI
jgi:carboxyl-terminal processing protease